MKLGLIWDSIDLIEVYKNTIQKVEGQVKTRMAVNSPRGKENNGRFWELLTYPSPNLKFCPKKEVSVNVRLGEG